METPIKMDDLWVPLFLETPICFICPPREKQVDTNTTNPHHSIYIHIVWNFESLGFWMPETDASITAYSAYSGLPCLHLDWISTIGGLFASKPNRYPQSVCHPSIWSFEVRKNPCVLYAYKLQSVCVLILSTWIFCIPVVLADIVCPETQKFYFQQSNIFGAWNRAMTLADVSKKPVTDLQWLL